MNRHNNVPPAESCSSNRFTFVLSSKAVPYPYYCVVQSYEFTPTPRPQEMTKNATHQFDFLMEKWHFLLLTEKKKEKNPKSNLPTAQYMKVPAHSVSTSVPFIRIPWFDLRRIHWEGTTSWTKTKCSFSCFSVNEQKESWKHRRVL